MNATATRKRRRAGLSLVEASVGVALVGSALAVFVPVFFRELTTSRLAEAPENLARLHAGAASYFAASHTQPDGPDARHCLPDATGRVPATTAPQARQVEFQAEGGAGAATFTALAFSPQKPVYFSYEVSPTRVGCALEGPEPLLTLRAYADLDGDGQESTFERTSGVDDDGMLIPLGALHVRNRTE